MDTISLDWQLVAAAKSGDVETCKRLIAAGVDVDTKPTDSPLWNAAAEGHLDVCKLLLDAGADVNLKDFSDWTPLHIVVGGQATSSHLEICKLLIDAGAEINALTKFGWTPLHTAAEGKQFAFCKLLIDAGADVNAKNPGITDASFRQPCRLSADDHAKNKGKTPLAVAKTDDIRQLLIAAGGTE